MEEIDLIDISREEEKQEVHRRKKKTQTAKKRKKTTKRVGIVVLLLVLTSFTSTFLALRYAKLYKECNEKVVVATGAEALMREQLDNQTRVYELQTKADAKNAYTKGVEAGMMKQEKQLLKAFRESTSEQGILKTLRDFYPEYIVYMDTPGYQFVPINRRLKQRPFLLEQLVNSEEGFIDYMNEGQVKSLRGIDVSKYNDNIQWDKIDKNQIQFAFVRVGYRGYGSGEIVADDNFEENVKGSGRAGLKTGVYFFTQALNEKEGVEEADFVLEQIKGLKIDFPIVIDVEKVNKNSARAENISAEDRTKAVIAFCDRIREAGYEPMIYGNIKCFMSMLEYEKLEEYKKWFAYYDTTLYFPYDISCWQYSEKGKVAGIKGAVDLNIWFAE